MITIPTPSVPSPTLTAEELRIINNQMIEGEAHYMKLEKEVTELQPLSPEKLREVLPTVVPDPTLSDLLSQAEHRRTELRQPDERLLAGKSGCHPCSIHD